MPPYYEVYVWKRVEDKFTIEDYGTGYNFVLNDDGYYESTNKGVHNSWSLCRVKVCTSQATTVTFTYINYAEAGYDFGIFSNIDSALSDSNTEDSSVYRSCKESSYNTSSVQTLQYSVSAGTHYIYIKYRKDSSANSGNDSLQFKVS